MPQADGSLLFDSKFDLAGFEVGVNMASDIVSGIGEKLKGLASSVLQTGMDFTASMSEVQALSGATGKELEALTETAKEYGASTQFTASESAQALKYMALAGWDTQQMTAGLPGILSLAASSGMELAQASDIVTDYLSAFGMEAEQSAYMADLLSYAQANSNTTVEQLSGAYKNCAANMHAAGQSVETTTALLAMMANQGFKGEEAGTALSAVVRDLSDKMQLADSKMMQSNQSLKGTADYIENLSDLQEQYVVTVGNTAVAVSDANGNYRQLTDILKDMEKATGTMSETERTAALQSTLTADSIKGVNVMLNAGVQNAEDFAVALQNSTGTAEASAETMQDNIKGDLASLSSAFEGLQLNVFDEMKAPIREVLQTLTETLQDSRTQKAASELGKVLADMAKTLANHLPDAISLVSDLVKKLWDNKGVIAGITAVVAAGKGISTATTSVKLLGTGLSKFAGGSSQALNGISAAMRGLNVAGVLATVVSGLITIKKVHEETTRKMYDDIYEVSDAVKKATETAEQSIDDFHERMQENQTELLDTDSELERIQELKQKLEELVNSDGTVKAGHEEEVKGILEQINAYAGTSYDVLDGVLTKNGEVITDFKKTSAELDTLIEKQHAQAVLSSFEDDYTQALQDQTEKTQELARARKEYNDALITYNTMQAENDQANAMHMNAPYDATEMAEAKKDLEEHAEAVRTLTQDFNNCTTMIENYEAAFAGVKNGDYSQLETLRQMAEEPIQTAETAASIDDLKAQYQDLSGVYEEMLQMKAEGFSIDDDALQATKAKLSAAIIELGKATGIDGGEVSGEQFMQALRDSTLSASEQVEAIKTFLREEGNSCADNYALGLAESLASTNNFGMVMNAAQILADSVPSTTRRLWGINSPSKVARGLSEYWNAGLAEGLLSNAGLVEQAAAASANGAIDATTDLFSDPIQMDVAPTLVSRTLDIMNARTPVPTNGTIDTKTNLFSDPIQMDVAPTLVSRTLDIMNARTPVPTNGTIDTKTNLFSNLIQTDIAPMLVSRALGIMNAQGAAAVSAYSPILQQVYTPQENKSSAVPTTSQQPQGDIIIPISIGDETLETVVVNAITRANASSGGWSV